jgi:hypothetical protein
VANGDFNLVAARLGALICIIPKWRTSTKFVKRDAYSSGKCNDEIRKATFLPKLPRLATTISVVMYD